MEIIGIIIAAVFVNNIVFSQFWESVLSGVSKNRYSHRNECSSYLCHHTVNTGYLSYSKGILENFGLEYLQTITFILVIAALVQMVEIIMKKSLPFISSTWRLLALITTNCIILGEAILVIQKDFNLVESIVYAISQQLVIPWP